MIVWNFSISIPHPHRSVEICTHVHTLVDFSLNSSASNMPDSLSHLSNFVGLFFSRLSQAIRRRHSRRQANERASDVSKCLTSTANRRPTSFLVCFSLPSPVPMECIHARNKCCPLVTWKLMTSGPTTTRVPVVVERVETTIMDDDEYDMQNGFVGRVGERGGKKVSI